jgi:Mg-chelatase subunit ChlD
LALSVEPAETDLPSWTDGSTIYLDGTLSDTDQIRALAVQAALIASGSLASDVLANLSRRSGELDRYLGIEGHRALAELDDVLPPSVRRIIDHGTAALSNSPLSSAGVAKSQRTMAPPPAFFGIIRPKQVRATRADSREDAASTVHAPRHTRDQILRELDDGEDSDNGRGFDMLNPVGGSGALGRLISRLLGTARSKGKGTPGAESATHRTRHDGRVSAGAAVSSHKAEFTDDLVDIIKRDFTYPEWNVFARAYKADWCTVSEVPPTIGSSQLAAVAPGAAALRRSLARLGLDLERRRRQYQGDEIDIDATVEARVALAAGSGPGEAIYIDSVRQRRELSVLVLLDISGSAKEPSESGRTVHDHQVAAAAGLTSALHGLGDRVALFGFRSQGRGAVQVVPVKRFAEAFDSLTLRRLGDLKPAGYTRLGAAIRHGSAILERDGGTARRLLVVLSDGFAYDHGYEGNYGEADARRALAEARRRGTACLCLTIGAGTDSDSLRRVFGTTAHARVPHVDQLPATAGPLFRTALRLTEVQRRTFQRKRRTTERLQIERRTA